MAKEKVAIIILNWNGKADTIECLNSLARIDTNKTDPWIIVVDNHSHDNSVNIFKEKFPGVTVIANNENLGFSGGNNVGIKLALEKKYDYILLLNNDTVVANDFLDALVTFSQSEKKAGIIAPVLKFKKGFEVFYDFGGVLNPIFGRAYHRQQSLLTDTTPKKTDYVSGACMLIKREVLEKIGLLDEAYFFGFEDVDFCLTTREAGYFVYLVPQALVEHKISASLGNSPLKIYYLLRNNLRFIKQKFVFPWTLTSYLYGLVLGAKMIVNQPRYFSVVGMAWWDFLRGKTGEKILK